MNISEVELAKYVGKKIRYYRKQAKLTQKELGAQINKSNNTISDYENGVTAPNQDSLFILARALGVKVDDFFPPRNTSELLEDSLLKTDEFSLAEMESFRAVTAYINTLDESKRREFLRNIDIALTVALEKTRLNDTKID